MTASPKIPELYERLVPDASGSLRSEVIPGLRLDVPAQLAALAP